jgi:hypothetical protein
MSHNIKRVSSKKTDKWYDIDVVVELLIHETPRGKKYAPEIGNLCIGFSSLSLDSLENEIEDLRKDWPFVFPKTLGTNDILCVIKKKYVGYKELLALKGE